MIKVRILRWGNYPGLSRYAQYNHKGPYKVGKRIRVRERDGSRGLRERVEDATLLSLKMEEGAMS